MCLIELIHIILKAEIDWLFRMFGKSKKNIMIQKQFNLTCAIYVKIITYLNRDDLTELPSPLAFP